MHRTISLFLLVLASLSFISFSTVASRQPDSPFDNRTPVTFRWEQNGSTEYSPKPVSELEVINHRSNLSSKEEKKAFKEPAKPYQVIGTLYFNKTWYNDSDLNPLIFEQACKHGGDAILLTEGTIYSSVFVAEDTNIGSSHESVHGLG